MTTGMEHLFPELLDSLVLGGHSGYGTSLRESSGDDGGGGIGTAWIVAVLLLAAVTVGLLVLADPAGGKARLKRVAPLGLMGVFIATPLAFWAASSGGAEQGLIVERATTPAGVPELIVYLADKDVNELRTTKGRKAVRVECLGPEGHVVLRAKRRWPFINDPGYDYPNIPQRASAEDVRRVERCRLRGTRVPLEADVEGELTS
jgi:hypothetical protein